MTEVSLGMSFHEMALRLMVAIILGGIIGFERELAGKEAGVRTDIMVAAGAAIFSMVGLELPYIIALSPANLAEVIARNSGFLGAVANVVVGIGFLGAGIIVKQGLHVRGLTTAATVWLVAAVGVLSGIGLLRFAVFSATVLTLLLILLRKLDFYKLLGKERLTHPEGDTRE
jgi:putative Mg2+ transporter-C (MgtC) family protein